MHKPKISIFRPLSQTMEVRNRHFSCFFDQFTPNTYVMIVTPGSDMPKALVKRNIAHARDAIQYTLFK